LEILDGFSPELVGNKNVIQGELLPGLGVHGMDTSRDKGEDKKSPGKKIHLHGISFLRGCFMPKA